MQKLVINSKTQKEVVDVTRILNDLFAKSGFLDGVAVLFLSHTSAALMVCDMDPGTEKDYLDAFDQIVPKLNYVHPHDPSHAGDHILSAMIGTSLSIPVQSGSMVLGQYQRVVILEFNGPKERRLNVTFLAEEGRRI